MDLDDDQLSGVLLAALPIKGPALEIGDGQDHDLVGTHRVHYGVGETAKKDSADGPIQEVARLGILFDLRDGMLDIVDEAVAEPRLDLSQ
jgi:hypothetical protein